MTLLIGPVSDYLVTQAEAAVVGLADDWDVWDGEADDLTNFMFVIGVNEPPADGGAAETLVSREWAGLGALHLDNDLTIPCFIDARIGQTTANANTAQKSVRDSAEAAFNAFWPLIKADLTLGGLVMKETAIPNVTGSARKVGTTGEPGRRYLIKFDVLARARTV